MGALRARWLGVVGIGAVGPGLGCGFEPLGASTWSPPANYKAWWLRTQECSGKTGEFSEVKWFVVPGESFECPDGKCVGRWEPGQRIYIASTYVTHEMVVRHEMLHALLNRSGHPNPPFAAGCQLTWDTWPGANPSRTHLGFLID